MDAITVSMTHVLSHGSEIDLLQRLPKPGMSYEAQVLHDGALRGRRVTRPARTRHRNAADPPGEVALRLQLVLDARRVGPREPRRRAEHAARPPFQHLLRLLSGRVVSGLW